MSITTVSHATQSARVQGGGTNPRIAIVSRHALLGGALGAAAGAALSFTALPFIGALTAPIAAAIGGAAGLVIGGIIGLIRSRNASADSRAGVMHLGSPAPNGTSSSALPPAPPA